MKIAINGAGIAGPTLAYWLNRYGHEIVLIEESPKLRSGGYIIDFWGVGYDIAEKMGILPRIRELGYQVEEVRFVDADGDKRGGFGTDVFVRLTEGRFTSIRRSDLARTIFDALPNDVETAFGDTITSINDRGDSVQMTLENSEPREVDLVIGADGLHSKVRGLAFGPEGEFEKELGYYVAAFELAGYEPRDELVYVSHALPGKQVSRFTMREAKTLFLFVFSDKFLEGGPPDSESEKKRALRRVYEEAKWECPKILELMESVDDIYFDRVSQIRMPVWTKGRVALLGDAAACVSLLAGEGTGLAMAEAYVLAGELNRCSSHAEAFEAYEARMRPFLLKKQNSAATFASSFVPATSYGITFRDLVTKLLRFRPVADYFIGRDLRDDIELPEYEVSA